MALSLAAICVIVVNRYDIVAPGHLQWLVEKYYMCSTPFCNDLLGDETKNIKGQMVCGACTCKKCDEPLSHTLLTGIIPMHEECYANEFGGIPILTWGPDWRPNDSVINRDGYKIDVSMQGHRIGYIKINAPGVHIGSFFYATNTQLRLESSHGERTHMEEYLYNLITEPLEKIPYEISYILGPLSN